MEIIKKDLFTICPKAKTWKTFLIPNSAASDSEWLLLNQQPKSIITYDREYYASFDGKVRVTIDQNLKKVSTK